MNWKYKLASVALMVLSSVLTIIVERSGLGEFHVDCSLHGKQLQLKEGKFYPSYLNPNQEEISNGTSK